MKHLDRLLARFSAFVQRLLYGQRPQCPHEVIEQDEFGDLKCRACGKDMT